MHRKTRIGIVGCGGMARSHARRFDRVADRVDVTALADIEPERARAVADLLPGSPRVSSDYRDILPDVDALLLVLPHHLHHPATIEGLRAGKHVLVEKPMANSEAECLDMIRTARDCDRILMVAYCMRFHPLVVEMKRLLDEKTFGEVFKLSIWTEQYTWTPPGHWTRSAATLGGGQFFSHGCHYIDLMLWMLGRPVRGAHFGTNRGTPWMEREGTSCVAIEFESGAIGYHGATWGARGTRLGWAMHAHCTEGMLEIDRKTGCLYLHSGAGEHVPDGGEAGQTTRVLMEAPQAKPTDEEMIHFVDCIESGAEPLTDAVSSLEGLQVIWELYRAEESNRLADLRGLGFGTLRLPG